MNDFVAFEPNRLDQLAKRLQSLTQALDGNLDQIKSIIEGLGGHIAGSSKTRYWATAAQDDANDMAFRAQKAWEAYRLEQKSPPFIGPVAHPGTVQLDWVQTSQGGRQAAADAASFNAAERDKDVKASRQQLIRLAESLRSHVNDADYLKTFWNAVDPAMAARLARILHDQDVASGGGRDGKTYPLSRESKEILAKVATGLVALKDNKIPLPRRVKEAMVNPVGDDLWSPIMLVSFGPRGDRWDPQLLAAMSHRELYRIDERGTYRDLDPMRAILTKVAESGAASRVLLGAQDTGVADAEMLMRTAALYQKTRFDGVPGIDDVAGNVMVSAAATSRDQSDNARQAAQAVANLISATHQWVQEKHGLNLELPAGVRSGMTRVAGMYLSDFARSSANPYDGLEIKGGNDEPWNVYTSHDLTREFLGEALKDPKDFGWLKGKARAYIAVASALSVLRHDNRLYAEESATFLGLLRSIDSEQAITKGHEKDSDASAVQSTLDTLNNLLGLIPGERLGALAAAAGRKSIGKGIQASLGHSGDAKTIADLFMKPNSGTEDAARIQAIRDTAKERFGITSLVVEGLIRAGKVPEPKDPSVYKDGHIIPGREFQYWYESNGAMPVDIGSGDRKNNTSTTLSHYVNQVAGQYKAVADWV